MDIFVEVWVAYIEGAILSTKFGYKVRSMKLSTDIKPISYLKLRSAELLKQVNETHRPVIITQNGEPRGVLQDTESYENMRNAIGLLKLAAQGEADIQKGHVIPQMEFFEEMESLLADK